MAKVNKEAVKVLAEFLPEFSSNVQNVIKAAIGLNDTAEICKVVCALMCTFTEKEFAILFDLVMSPNTFAMCRGNNDESDN